MSFSRLLRHITFIIFRRHAFRHMRLSLFILPDCFSADAALAFFRCGEHVTARHARTCHVDACILRLCCCRRLLRGALRVRMLWQRAARYAAI